MASGVGQIPGALAVPSRAPAQNRVSAGSCRQGRAQRARGQGKLRPGQLADHTPPGAVGRVSVEAPGRCTPTTGGALSGATVPQPLPKAGVTVRAQ